MVGRRNRTFGSNTPSISPNSWSIRIRIILHIVIVACLGATTLLPGASTAAGDDPLRAPPPIVTQECAACHGVDGNSANTAIPSLAGQGAHYLYDELTAFKAQRRTGVMSAIAVGLSPDDMRVLSAYFSTQPPKPDRAFEQDLMAQGESIYRDGIAAKQVPACASCHSLSGAGLPPEFPRLAGAHPEYIAQQLRAFRSGARASNPNAMMRVVSNKLSDREIEAVAQYVASLP